MQVLAGLVQNLFNNRQENGLNAPKKAVPDAALQNAGGQPVDLAGGDAGGEPEQQRQQPAVERAGHKAQRQTQQPVGAAHQRDGD